MHTRKALRTIVCLKSRNCLTSTTIYERLAFTAKCYNKPIFLSTDAKCYTLSNEVSCEKVYRQRSQKINRLISEGVKFMKEGEYSRAEAVLECVLAMHEDTKYNQGLDEEKNFSRKTQTLLNIASCKQYQGKLDEASKIYAPTILELEKRSCNQYTFGIHVHNYANLSAQLGDYEMAMKLGRRAIDIMSSYCSADSDLMLALKSAMAGYLCGARMFEEAVAIAESVYKQYLCRFGRDNDYTRSAYSNYYFVLKKLGREDDMKNLYDTWMAYDDSVSISQLYQPEALNAMTQKLSCTLSPHLRMTQPGFVRSPKLRKAELIGFVKYCRDRNIDVEHESLHEFWSRESATLKQTGQRLQSSLVTTLSSSMRFLKRTTPMYEPIMEKMVLALPVAKQVNEKLSRHNAERHEQLLLKHKQSQGIAKGPTPEFLHKVEEMEKAKKEKREAQEKAAKIAAEKAAQEAAEKAAKEAQLKSKKGKKK